MGTWPGSLLSVLIEFFPFQWASLTKVNLLLSSTLKVKQPGTQAFDSALECIYTV